MPAGRPLKFKSAKELQDKIDEYFDSCWVDKVIENTDKDGNCTMSTVRYQNEPYTVAGLAAYLGFHSRQSLLNYEGKPEFVDVIKKAKLKIEACWEAQLYDGKGSGPIFWLKNHAGYRDKQEVAHTGTLTLEQIVAGANEPSDS